MTLLRLGLRSAAVAIAIAGLVDPAWTVSRPPSQALVLIRASGIPNSEVEQALRAALPGWEIEPRALGSSLPCEADERCVVIADGTRDVGVPRDLVKPLSLVTDRAAGDPNVSVRSVSVSGGHQHAAGVARIELARTPSVATSEIRIVDGTAVIGATTYQWAGESAAATIEVPWWPIATGARRLRASVLPLDDERVTIDNHIDVGVTVAVTRASVLVFDTRPSWSSTFVRRALEDDPRFTVGYRTRLAPALSAGTANGRLDAAALDLASAVVIGAPDGLTSDDVALLEQFVRVRGGSLILLPERSPSGPWARLVQVGQGTVGPAWTEHLTATPEPVGPLRASEVLRVDRLPVTAGVVARSGPAASIVVLPSGFGRIVVSGAMDAWRYRDLDSGGFDRFWQSLIAESAASGEGPRLAFDQLLAAGGERARFTLHDRRMSAAASSEASAVARCGAGPAMAIRLWPAGPPSAFSGELPLSSGAMANRGAGEAGCTIEATINDRHASGSIAVAERLSRGVEPTLAKLEREVARSGGVAAAAGEEAVIARALTAAAVSPDVATAIHPMRSGWWLLPFAAALSFEWWLRRRIGLR